MNRLIGWAREASGERSREATEGLFGVLAEGLADRFDARLVDDYVRIFSNVFAAVHPQSSASELLARYQRVRKPRRFPDEPGDDIERVFVLSRVTLGADLAITSTILDATKIRFPEARIVLVGPRKNWELFAGDDRIGHLAVAYPRGASLLERLSVWPALARELSGPRNLVIDPDSRLTQLGLLPVCAEERYLFFESRSYGDEGRDSLYRLTRDWLAETLGVEAARPYLAPAFSAGSDERPIAVSLGVGGNELKRIPGSFERDLLRGLVALGRRVILDRGGGGEEGERVDSIVSSLGEAPAGLSRFEGSFAAFADIIARSALYVGYDSAGQHVAAVSGVPLVVLFAGYPNERFLERWTPDVESPSTILRIETPTEEGHLERALTAVEQHLRPEP